MPTHSFTVEADLDAVRRAMLSIGTVAIDRTGERELLGILAGGGGVSAHGVGARLVEVWVEGFDGDLAAWELADLLTAYLDCAVTRPVRRRSGRGPAAAARR